MNGVLFFYVFVIGMGMCENEFGALADLYIYLYSFAGRLSVLKFDAMSVLNFFVLSIGGEFRMIGLNP